MRLEWRSVEKCDETVKVAEYAMLPFQSAPRLRSRQELPNGKRCCMVRRVAGVCGPSQVRQSFHDGRFLSMDTEYEINNMTAPFVHPKQ